MTSPHVQFLGPTLRPIRKWILGFAILGFFAVLLAFGLFGGFPPWLQLLGWAFVGVLYCVSNLAWYPNDGRRKKRRFQIYSLVVPRGPDDQPCDKPKP
jgi:hypothetical protein